MLTGLWHGAAWNFVAWGLLFALFLMAEKYLPLQKLPEVLRHGYVVLVVVISFVIFNAQSLAQAWSDIGGMFGAGGIPLATTESVYYLKSYGLLLVVGIVGATPLVRNIAAGISRRKAGEMLRMAVAAALLLICTAYLVDGSFNPFLYFRF
jgi:alginate O-acetyltransferase complex protein AlgI